MESTNAGTNRAADASTSNIVLAISNLRNSINQFSFKLLDAFATRHVDNPKNLCLSPLEVFNSLVMILLGAKGVTEAQLEDMLCLEKFNAKSKYDELIELRQWIIKSNYDFMIYGSFIYADTSVKIKDDYLQKLKTIFEIKPKLIDFSNAEEAIKIINKDAHDVTDGVIANFISSKDLADHPNVNLILSNAAFFRGFWQMKFGDIKKEPFTFAKGTKTADVDMMTHVGMHRYCFDPQLSAQAVSIAYVASDIRMVIILPLEVDKEPAYLVNLLNAEKLSTLFFTLQGSPKVYTRLTIPRFALEAEKVSLQKSVQQMGAKSMYDEENAQLSGISNKEGLYLTKLVHKAFILIDERGSQHQHLRNLQEEQKFMKEDEAGPSARGEPNIFIANHPFLFVILDKITHVICFTGLLTDPESILEVVNEKDLSKEEIQQLLAEQD